MAPVGGPLWPRQRPFFNVEQNPALIVDLSESLGEVVVTAAEGVVVVTAAGEELVVKVEEVVEAVVCLVVIAG